MFFYIYFNFLKVFTEKSCFFDRVCYLFSGYRKTFFVTLIVTDNEKLLKYAHFFIHAKQMSLFSEQLLAH
jgi:hypothetical protein